MAFHNVNYEIVPLTGGTYTTGQLGNGLTASTVHEVYCLTAGTIYLAAIGGGSGTFPMTAGQTVKILLRQCTVQSGGFVGFRTKLDGNGISINQF